ncbi:MAG: tail fiber domain-containing protein, partial [Bdellovibrio sp.]
MSRNIHKICVSIVVLMAFAYGLKSQAAPASLTYQGRIVKSNGKGLEYNNVSFIFQITDPAGTCVIYQEQVTGYDMTNSQGVFDVPIGNGTIQFPLGGATSILDVFNNSSTFTCGSCSSSSGTYTCVTGSGTYAAASGDIRKLRVSFYDGTGWKTITPDNTIRSVPFAGFALSAQKLGNNVANDFLLKAGLPTCSAGNYLTYDGTNLTCSPVTASGSGTVASLTSTNAYLTVVNGNSAPALTVNVGTTANTVAAGNDSRFTDARTPTGAAGGSLSGTYPNPTLIDAAVTTSKINDGAVTTAKLFSNPGVNRLVASDGTTGSTLAALSCSAGQLLTWNVATGWQCTSQSSLAVGSATTASTATNFSGSLVGDVGGTQGATSVNKIKGIALDFSTAPTNGQVLKFNGTSWAPSADNAGVGTVTNVSGTAPIGVATGTSTPVISLANGSAAGQVYRWDGTSSWVAAKLKYTDLVNATAGNPWPTTTCAAGEAVTWSSASDSFSCTSLTIATSQLNGTLNAAQMPAFTGGDVTSSAGSLNLSLANSGVTAGTYKSVTVDAKGRVTAGTNPTTLSGYGITDAIKNLGGVGNMSADLDANKPGTPSSGDLFVATDTQKIY